MKTKYSSIILIATGIAIIIVLVTMGCNKNEDAIVGMHLKATKVTLTASAACPQYANLKWSYTGTANATEIYQNTKNDLATAKLIATVSPTIRTYKVSGLKNLGSYIFWVKVRLSSDNVWYTSNYFYLVINCSASSASGSSGGR